MDWKNIAAGAASLELFPVTDYRMASERLMKEVSCRQHRDGSSMDEALNRIMRERKIGQLGLSTILFLSLVGTLAFALANNQPAMYACITLYGLGWLSPIAWLFRATYTK